MQPNSHFFDRRNYYHTARSCAKITPLTEAYQMDFPAARGNLKKNTAVRKNGGVM